MNEIILHGQGKAQPMRNDADIATAAGTVRVHFPRSSFHIKADQP